MTGSSAASATHGNAGYPPPNRRNSTDHRCLGKEIWIMSRRLRTDRNQRTDEASPIPQVCQPVPIRKLLISLVLTSARSRTRKRRNVDSACGGANSHGPALEMLVKRSRKDRSHGPTGQFQAVERAVVAAARQALTIHPAERLEIEQVEGGRGPHRQAGGRPPDHPARSAGECRHEAWERHAAGLGQFREEDRERRLDADCAERRTLEAGGLGVVRVGA